jgi:hypothetical protein
VAGLEDSVPGAETRRGEQQQAVPVHAGDLAIARNCSIARRLISAMS